jgi:alpha-amylase
MMKRHVPGIDMAQNVLRRNGRRVGRSSGRGYWLWGLSLALFLWVAGVQLSDGGTLIALQHQPGDPDRPWTWSKIMQSMDQLKAVGYTAILISPHQAACGGGFSLGYDPYDFRVFDSAHGTADELALLVQKAHAAGLQIYADMVLNHMCSHNFKYPRFQSEHFHHFGGINDWHDQWQLENGSLFGLEDLNQDSSYVRGELWAFLVKTNNMGFDGYRWDAAKHVPRWFWKDQIVNNVNAWGKYNFGEVYDANIGYLLSYVDTGMAVTDYNLYFTMRDSFQFAGNLAALDGAGLAAVNGAKALTFVENHDVGPPVNRILAYAFLAAYPGYPCFFKVSLDDPVINNLVWIHNNLADGEYQSRFKDQNTLIFQRGNRLLASISQRDQWTSHWVQTSWSNTRLHDYAGHVEDKWTNASGWVEVWIPPMSYVMMGP